MLKEIPWWPSLHGSSSCGLSPICDVFIRTAFSSSQSAVLPGFGGVGTSIG